MLMALEHLIRANDIYVQDKTQTGLCQKRLWYQFDEMTRSIASYKGHLKHGHTYRLKQRVFHNFVLTKEKKENTRLEKEGEQYEEETDQADAQIFISVACGGNACDGAGDFSEG